MTKDAVIDVVHKVICSFFDVVADDSEEPMSEKDKLLLEVNKALCNAIKNMPDDERNNRDMVSRSDVISICNILADKMDDEGRVAVEQVRDAIKDMRPYEGGGSDAVD